MGDRRLKMSPRDRYNSTLYNYRSLFDNRYHWGAISWLGGDPKRRTDYDELFGLYEKNNTQIQLIIYHIYSKYFIVAKSLINNAFSKKNHISFNRVKIHCGISQEISTLIKR